ncbi:MAG: hypothetical protein KGZ58_00095 [Ignavibacteriales bacterium]|nr:hypothetical protein [Ignavibacteriales bacterium]
MEQLLTKAFERASQLPKPLQEKIAEELLEDIEAELKWDSTLAKSQDKLEQLAEKALTEFKSGKTKQLGFDEL